MQILDDFSAMNLIKSGDNKAFRYLFEKYYGPLFEYINRNLKNSFATEEIIQDIFIKMWEKRNEIEIRIAVKTYLFQAARNRIKNYRRDNHNVGHYNILPEEIGFEDNTIEFQELQNLIENAISVLPQKCSEIYRMSRVQNLANLEIAKVRGISVRTVENHIARALQIIKARLTDGYSFYAKYH